MRYGMRYGRRALFTLLLVSRPDDTMIGKPKRKVTEPRPARPVPAQPRMPLVVLIRAFLLGSVAVVACIWAIWRHYYAPPPSLLVPRPAPTEIEVEPPP